MLVILSQGRNTRGETARTGTSYDADADIQAAAHHLIWAKGFHRCRCDVEGVGGPAFLTFSWLCVRACSPCGIRLSLSASVSRSRDPAGACMEPAVRHQLRASGSERRFRGGRWLFLGAPWRASCTEPSRLRAVPHRVPELWSGVCRCAWPSLGLPHRQTDRQYKMR